MRVDVERSGCAVLTGGETGKPVETPVPDLGSSVSEHVQWSSGLLAVIKAGLGGGVGAYRGEKPECPERRPPNRQGGRFGCCS